MRILNVNISLDTKSGGGTAERTFQMTYWLNHLGIDCKVLVLDLGSSGERIIKIPDNKILKLKCINKRFYIPAISIRSIKKLIKDIDIVHLMSHWTLLNAIVYLLARYYCISYVVCPAGALSYVGRSPKLKKIYNKIIGHRIIRDAAFCIAICPDEVEEFASLGVAESKITLIPNGINVEEYVECDTSNFRVKFNLSKKKIILFIGRLNYIKGVDLLVNAFCTIFEHTPDYQLVIAGPDEGMQRGLQKTIIENNMTDCISFIGYLDSEIKRNAYYASSLLVIPSRQEAMSIVVLEAGITGTPVLMTNKCGFNEIENIKGGKIVDATSVALERGLLDLLNNESKLEQMGENLKKHVNKNYTWPIIANKYINMFRQVLKA